MKLRTALPALALPCLLALGLPKGAVAQTENTTVTTPAASTHGSLASGNLPCATSHNQVGDCSPPLPASSVTTATNTQTLQNKTISGAQNTLTAISDSALSADIARLGANTFTGLQSLLAGVALPLTTNPTGSNLYLDANGALHIVNSNGDFQGLGAKFSGDARHGPGLPARSAPASPNHLRDNSQITRSFEMIISMVGAADLILA